VVWITGLAGSGKTTVATALAARLRARGVPVILLDGDALRRAIARDLGYEVDERRRGAERYARLAVLLAGQGYTVLVATISMFEAVRRWSRRAAPGYLEVYLRLPPGVAPRRRGRRAAGAPLVVGLDLPFEPPVRPDLALVAGATPARDVAARILAHLHGGRIVERPRRGR
jgi:adenylylsulfate kinase